MSIGHDALVFGGGPAGQHRAGALAEPGARIPWVRRGRAAVVSAVYMSDSGPASSLRGRHSECEALDRLLAGVSAGGSQVLVVRGESGVGKTALLGYLLGRASGCRIARAAGVESEEELAFAGLHQLCAPFLDRLERLPGPQRDALGTAFGLSTGEPPDRFLVGLAVLSLLADVAEEGPLLCLVDDAQWLDRVSAQTLAFVARRLLAESVAVVFAVREPTDHYELAGLDELVLDGLSNHDAHALLDSVISGPVDERVRERVVAETRGNPLALLELPRGLTAAELAFGFGTPDGMPLASRIEEGFLRRLEPLPVQTRRLLLAAAVEPIGDATLLWRAAEQLGIDGDAAAPAGESGLIEIGARVRFRHPLVRSAAYRAASPKDRQEVHRALAEVTDPDLDPDRRAWHRAHAASGPDETVANELEHSAGRAQERGGLAAAAALLEESARLTLDPARRARRALATAQAKHQAGEPEAALALLAMAQAGPFDELQRARVDLLRAKIAFAVRRGNDSPPLLLGAARQLEPLDIGLARETYLDAFSAALIVGRLSLGADLTEVATTAREAPAASTPERPADLLLDGLTTLITEGRAAATPLLQRALKAFRSADISTEEELRWLWLAGRVAQDLWDDESWEVLCAQHVRITRQAGALTVLPIALRSRIFVHAFWGQLDEGAALCAEALTVSEASGTRLAAYGGVALAAYRGGEVEASRLIEATVEDVASRGEGMGLGISHFATALLYNGLGRYSDALTAAESACEYDDLGVLAWALTELVEAAARSGKHETAAAALQRLSLSTRAAGTDWALGIEARSGALVSDDETAEELYREAIDRLGRTRVRVELARAHLLYGEWLRRENRRLDAREQLRSAHELFTAMGVEGFAERARRELLATGETVRKRTPETRDDLTAQETQIARLAGDGRTNPEIGAELFISPRTVEWHLRKVFAKLDISSRKQLRGALPDSGRAVLSA
jgi:DNA-binding CsgD family transcriptional regulator/tetratricopeptide (TPR) repeat protein